MSMKVREKCIYNLLQVDSMYWCEPPPSEHVHTFRIPTTAAPSHPQHQALNALAHFVVHYKTKATVGRRRNMNSKLRTDEPEESVGEHDVVDTSASRVVQEVFIDEEKKWHIHFFPR